MKRVFVLGQACVWCSVSLGMTPGVWEKYEAQLQDAVSLTVAEHHFTADDVKQWCEVEKQKIEQNSGDDDLKAELSGRANEILAEYQCLVDYGLTLTQYKELAEILFSIYPSEPKSVKDKMISARKTVQPSLYNTASSFVSYFLPGNNSNWARLDSFLKGINKNRSVKRLARKMGLLQKNVEKLSKTSDEQQLLRYEAEALNSLKMRVKTVKSGLISSLASLTAEIKESIINAVLKTVSKTYGSPMIVSFVQELLGASRNSSLDQSIEQMSSEERKSLSMGIDALVLLVNAELGKMLNVNAVYDPLKFVVKEKDNEFRLVNSNIKCSRSFVRGGWIEAEANNRVVRFSFGAITEQEWENCSLSIQGSPFFFEKNFCAIGPIQNIFSPFMCKVIHINADGNSVFLCGDGEGGRAYCIVFNKGFIFCGDLLSDRRINDINQRDDVYLEAVVDSGTFVNAQKSVQVKSKMTFREACQAFMDGKLDGKVTPRKLTYSIEKNPSPVSMEDTRTPQKKKRKSSNVAENPTTTPKVEEVASSKNSAKKKEVVQSPKSSTTKNGNSSSKKTVDFPKSPTAKSGSKSSVTSSPISPTIKKVSSSQNINSPKSPRNIAGKNQNSPNNRESK